MTLLIVVTVVFLLMRLLPIEGYFGDLYDKLSPSQREAILMLQTALSIPGTIGWEVFLTYIGLGLPVSIPSLGNLVNEGRIIMMSPELRYQLIFPTIVLSIITISFYVLGNAFSDASDPRNHV